MRLRIQATIIEVYLHQMLSQYVHPKAHFSIFLKKKPLQIPLFLLKRFLKSMDKQI